MERKLKSYMGYKITKYTTENGTKWVARNEIGCEYESKKSLADLKERIYLDEQSIKLSNYIGKVLGLGK